MGWNLGKKKKKSGFRLSQTVSVLVFLPAYFQAVFSTDLGRLEGLKHITYLRKYKSVLLDVGIYL